jgi:GntR family transcriptional regulator, transcriptional repressor for pyruvate dehydrogenase complex
MTLLAPSHQMPEATAIDTVFDALLADIVRGTYTAGTRLPAERELAKTLGASRPTLREALRRLGEWNLVEPRRGSGVVVRSWREWSIEVLPAYLRYSRPGPGQPVIPRLLADLMAMRRALILDVIRQVAPRIRDGGTLAARAASARAWAARNDPRQFIREDLEIMRSIAESAMFVPGMWLLNRLATIYVEIGAVMHGAIRPSDDYLDVHHRLFDALDRGDAETSVAIMTDWLTRGDTQIIRALGVEL